MKKIGFVLLVCLFIVSSVVVGETSQTTEYKISSEVYEELQKNDEVRVIVELKEDIQEEKQEVISKIGEDKVKNEFEDSFSAIVSEKDLDKLEDDDNVESVDVVGVRRIFLQDSVPLIKAKRTHTMQIDGINLTGKGQTVCIIDTGVNYSHPDLGGCYGNNNASSDCKIVGGWNYVNGDSDPMDDNGHGTHVTGIVAANGSITGVALGAKIVALKACDSGGSCPDDAIKKSIEWCTNNASLFNISVISMSLGSGLYPAYCNDDYLVASINAAVRENISVVIAAGNGLDNVGPGRADQIASPACVENATPVSAVDKNDNIDTTYADRNELVLLMAPGSYINSTYLSNPEGGYASASGTSMATPHVAGAIAIMKQFLVLRNQSKTPEEIEIVLNNTGKKIIDTVAGAVANYSRIDIYRAILTLDTPPIITINSPKNITYLNTTIDFNVTLDENGNCLYSLNSGKTNYTMSSNNTINFNATNSTIDDGGYTAVFYCNNSLGNPNSSSVTFTTKSLNVSLDTPLSGSLLGNKTQNFTCSAETYSVHNLTNMTLYLWDSNSLYYNTTKNIFGTSATTTFEYNLTVDGTYKWNCEACNNASKCGLAGQNYTLTIDTTFPTVSLVSPGDSSTYTSSNTVTFTYNVADINSISNCSLVINNKVNSTSTSVTKGTDQTFSVYLPNATYSWSVNCTDALNNIGSSAKRTLTVSYSVPPPSNPSSNNGGDSGGGGGGGTTASVHEDTECIEDWVCGEWGLCLEGGIQTRTCTDENLCDTDEDKPEDTQSCEYIAPESGEEDNITEELQEVVQQEEAKQGFFARMGNRIKGLFNGVIPTGGVVKVGNINTSSWRAIIAGIVIMAGWVSSYIILTKDNIRYDFKNRKWR